MRWFVLAFAISEVVLLTLKGIIYLSDHDWWSDPAKSTTQVIFFVLHILRLVFPITLIVKLG